MKLYQNLKKLVDYKPATRGCTSVDEINYIKETLDIENASNDDIQNYRDMCVMMWEKKLDHTSDVDSTWDAMQSITAVIDMYKMSRGMEV